MGAGVVANPIDGNLRTPTMKPESIASVMSILIGKGPSAWNRLHDLYTYSTD
jgi:hypothetical protein